MGKTMPHLGSGSEWRSSPPFHREWTDADRQPPFRTAGQKKSLPGRLRRGLMVADSLNLPNRDDGSHTTDSIRAR